MDIFLLFNQFGVCAAGLVNYRGCNLGQERAVNAEQLAVTRSAAQQAAQHIAAAFVGRDNAVTDHHNGRTDVIGDNAQGDICLFAVAVVLARNFRNLVCDVAHGIYIKQ